MDQVDERLFIAAILRIGGWTESMSPCSPLVIGDALYLAGAIDVVENAVDVLGKAEAKGF